MVGAPHLHAIGAYANSMGNNAWRSFPLHRPRNSSAGEWPEAAFASTSTDPPPSNGKASYIQSYCYGLQWMQLERVDGWENVWDIEVNCVIRCQWSEMLTNGYQPGTGGKISSFILRIVRYSLVGYSLNICRFGLLNTCCFGLLNICRFGFTKKSLSSDWRKVSDLGLAPNI